jgi:hypothetical protein
VLTDRADSSGDGDDEASFSTSGEAAEEEAASETPGARRRQLRRSSCGGGSLRLSSGGEKAGARVEEWSREADGAIFFFRSFRRWFSDEMPW